MKQIEDHAAAPAAEDSGRQAKLSLKEIRTALGEAYKPILTVAEASALGPDRLPAGGETRPTDP